MRVFNPGRLQTASAGLGEVTTAANEPIWFV